MYRSDPRRSSRLGEFEGGFQAGVDLGHEVAGQDSDPLENEPFLDSEEVGADHRGILTKTGPLAFRRRDVDEELRGFVDSGRLRRDHRDDGIRLPGVVPVVLDDYRGPSIEATPRREWITYKDNIASTRKQAGTHCRCPSPGRPNPQEQPPGPSAGTHPGCQSRRITHACARRHRPAR